MKFPVYAGSKIFLLPSLGGTSMILLFLFFSSFRDAIFHIIKIEFKNFKFFVVSASIHIQERFPIFFTFNTVIKKKKNQ